VAAIYNNMETKSWKIKAYGYHDTFALDRASNHRETLIVVCNNGKTLAVDAPSYIYPALANDSGLVSESRLTRLDYLVVTHIDADHIGGLDTLLWAKYFGEQSKLNLITLPSIRDLLWDRLKGAFGHDRMEGSLSPKVFGDYINFFPVKWGAKSFIPGFGSIRVFNRSTKHSLHFDTLAFCLYDQKDKIIAGFSSDTPFDEELISFLAQPGGVIFHEAGAYRPLSSAHTHFSQLFTLSANIQKRMVLCHIPEVLEDDLRREIVAKDSSLRIADDFMPEHLVQSVGAKGLKEFFKADAVYPGTFDPFTYGHLDIVTRYLERYPKAKLCIMTGTNPRKKPVFSPDERIFLIKNSIPVNLRDRVEVRSDDGVIADYLYENTIPAFIKGVRDEADFVYESTLAALNSRLSGEPITLLVPQTDPSLTSVSSSNLKMLISLGINLNTYATSLVRESLRILNMGQMLIGVTGGIASGKSTFCKELSSFGQKKDLKIHFINFDKFTRIILGSKDNVPLYFGIRQKIVDRFGRSVLNVDDTINHKKLGEIVFDDRNLLKELTDMMLEALLYLFSRELRGIGPGIVLVEGAIFIERELTELVDNNLIIINLPLSLQRKRLSERGFDADQIEHRISSQLTGSERVERGKIMQKGEYDRLFVTLEGEHSFNVENIYDLLFFEYGKRAKVVR